MKQTVASDGTTAELRQAMQLREINKFMHEPVPYGHVLAEGTANAFHTAPIYPALQFRRKLRLHYVDAVAKGYGLMYEPRSSMITLNLGRRMVVLSWWQELVQ